MVKKKDMELQQKANKIRKRLTELAYQSQKAVHFGGSLSEIEIILSIYQVMKQREKLNEEDIFILSKGHGAIGYYVILEELGYMSNQEMNSILQNGSPFQCLITKNEDKGFLTSGGSLGHGLAFAIGRLLQARYQGRDKKAYVLLGDGECQEGSVWEAFMLAGHQQLNNLIAVIDMNQMQIDGNVSDIVGIPDLAASLTGLGWNCFHANGHNVDELIEIMQNLPKNQKPTAILAKTVKGKGIDFMENSDIWHQGILTEKQYISIMENAKGGR